MPAAPTVWDLFCRVIDNHGDLGVCWRLACELAARGQQARLWVDDASALAWMAPQGLRGQVPGCRCGRGASPSMPRPWPACRRRRVDRGLRLRAAAGLRGRRAGRHGAGVDQPGIPERRAYVERCTACLRPCCRAGGGLDKWFFYPGFTPRTGGLLREADLPARQAAFDRAAWLARRACPAGRAAAVAVLLRAAGAGGAAGAAGAGRNPRACW
jgi:hypothetical protein